MRNLLFLVLTPVISLAQSLEGIEVYEISDMVGAQVYYASHIKLEAMKDSKKIDDEDRAALLGAIGKTGIAMPRFKVPYTEDNTTVKGCKMSVITIKDKDGSLSQVAQNEHKGGKDELMVIRSEDVINCLLVSEGVIQLYTIHLNVTFPEGEKLVTMQTTRNRPLGVSTLTVTGKAKRIK
jgi:hypothetical protein